MVSLDVPPYCMAAGDRASLHGLNVVGLKRRGMSDEELDALRAAYRTLFQSGLRLAEALERARAEGAGSKAVAHLLDFIAASKRGFCR